MKNRGKTYMSEDRLEITDFTLVSDKDGSWYEYVFDDHKICIYANEKGKFETTLMKKNPPIENIKFPYWSIKKQIYYSCIRAALVRANRCLIDGWEMHYICTDKSITPCSERQCPIEVKR